MMPGEATLVALREFTSRVEAAIKNGQHVGGNWYAGIGHSSGDEAAAKYHDGSEVLVVIISPLPLSEQLKRSNDSLRTTGANYPNWQPQESH